MHLILDGQAGNIRLMTDKVLMREWLRETVEVAGMKPFGEPFIWGFPWPGSRDWTALTGFQPLIESGLSVHCWPERMFVFVDLFSCNEFDSDKVIKHISESFRMDDRLEKPTVIILDRGINPKSGWIMPAKVRTFL